MPVNFPKCMPVVQSYTCVATAGLRFPTAASSVFFGATVVIAMTAARINSADHFL